MLLGPAGVGKSSLVRGLKKFPFTQEVNSTQLADVRPISYNWATGDWKDVYEQDELDEVAKLLATVYHDGHGIQDTQQLVSSVKSVRTLYGDRSSVLPASTEQVNEVKNTKVDSYLEGAIKRASQLTPDDIWVLKPNPILHIWDCGGQPIFLEVLPAFLTPRTKFLLLFDASKDFKERWKSVQFQQGRDIPGEEVNMTISELLDKWMATIHSHLSSKTEKGDLLDYPRILGIGTHGDGLNEREKQSVIGQFHALCSGNAYLELLDDIFIVDNTTAGRGRHGEDPGFERVRESILQFAKKLVVKTPVSWVLFRKIIQMFAKESKNVITYSEAKAIGVACKIKAEDIHKVLMFYHDLGVILYYSHIRNLQDKVILSPRWFVESLGKVLTLQGRETYQTEEMWRILRENGILIQPLYVAVWRECEDIDPEGMMELLVCFHLAALVKTEVYYDLNAPQYFVPSALPLFTGDQASPVNAILRATPLHITFSTKFVPPGYFTRFVTTMASFKACQLHFKNGIYRNLVSFKFGDGKKYDDVTFTELPGAIQVDIIRNFPDRPEYTSFNIMCEDLFILLEESCKEVDECFHQSSPSSNIHRKFRFLCKSVECSSAADVHYLKDTDEYQTQSDPCSCEENDALRRLTEEEAYWFPAVPQQNVKVVKYTTMCISVFLLFHSLFYMFSILTGETYLTKRNVADITRHWWKWSTFSGPIRKINNMATDIA